MALAAGTHTLGPDAGTLEIHTFRDGVAQKVGHDLIIDVGGWRAEVEVAEIGLHSVTLDVDTRSFTVREGRGGVKPLSDGDKAEVIKNIDEKVLRGEPVSFRSDGVETTGGLTVRGQLTIVGTTRPTMFELELSDDGRVIGTLPVVQSEWGIKPYRALMGALKVRDELEVVLDVALPTN
jgi:polyisoprenoid-binding protein YceI